MVSILVVDDDPGIRQLLEVTLEGHEVTFAKDGVEALELLPTHKVDVVVLDVMMPRLDGIETLRRIRVDSKNQELPVILLSAKVNEDDHLRGYQAGADAYVTKPFDPEYLERVIEEVRRRSPEDRERIREAEKAKAALLRQVERRFR
ncbi:MAG: response regulator transcription factor [Nitriliruptorales bacterium]